MTSDHSYYDSLKRRYLAAERKYSKIDDEEGEDILLKATPSSPSELRQYIDLVAVFLDEMSNTVVKSIYKEVQARLAYWERERPGDQELVRARKGLKPLKKRMRKIKMETPLALCASLGITAGFIASLYYFPGWAAFVKKLFWFEYIKSWIILLFM